MNRRIHPFDVPTNSEIRRHLPGAYFQDCHVMPIPPEAGSALAIYLRMVGQTPRWVDRLITLRNRLVRLVGLKDLGQTKPNRPASDYRVGDRVGILTVQHLNDDEVILGEVDKHLDVRVSVCRIHAHGRPEVVITTVVHVHNTLGRLYMAIVAPIHRRIVPAMLASMDRRILPG